MHTICKNRINNFLFVEISLFPLFAIVFLSSSNLFPHCFKKIFIAIEILFRNLCLFFSRKNVELELYLSILWVLKDTIVHKMGKTKKFFCRCCYLNFPYPAQNICNCPLTYFHKPIKNRIKNVVQLIRNYEFSRKHTMSHLTLQIHEPQWKRWIQTDNGNWNFS